MTNVPYYNERFPMSAKARIASRAVLEEFMATWKYHHKLQPEQLEYADRLATVEEVSFYHGADPVCKLEGIPGLWLDQCLQPV